MRYICVAALAALLTVQPGATWAATLDGLMAAAQTGDWAQAEAEAAALDGNEGQADFYSAYVAARRLAQTGRCAEAVVLFDALAMSRPYFAPAYEGAFLCLHAMEETDEAVARLDSMLAILPDGAHRDIVFQVRQQVASADRPVISLFGSLIPSSNANRQTAESSLGAWTIAPAAQSKPGLLASLGASVTARLYAKDTITASAVGTAAAYYNSATGLLEPRFTLETPLTFSLPGNALAGLTPFATVGFDGGGVSQAKAGLNGVVSVPLTETFKVALSGGISYAGFPQQSFRDGWQYNVALSADWIVDPQWLLSASAKAAVNATNAAAERTSELSGSLRVDHAMDWGLLVGIEGEAGIRFHAQPAPLSTGAGQIDRFASVVVELSHRDIVFGPFMPQIHYRYAIQDSDNVFYRYQAHDVGLGMRARF